ncbi:MAG: DUF5706 domain-containing protein [Chitinophagales bacterium]
MENEKHQQDIVDLVREYVQTELSKVDSNYLYHNLKHTEQVVSAASQLADDFNLNAEEKEMLIIAAWFHDIAYSMVKTGHEEKGAEIATVFLKSHHYPENRIETIKQCILSTQINVKPNTFLEQLIKDADCAHLGKKNAQKRSDLLRMENELIEGKKVSDLEWLNENISFLKRHQYYTTIAKTKWEAVKIKNLKQLEKRLDNTKNGETPSSLKSKQAAALKRSRGVETMFRITLPNHIKLSTIADNKANFLLSISGIILSLLLGELITDNKPVQSFLMPTMYFLVVLVITMILSILATRPNITKGKFSKESILNKKSNILFFGNFHAMPLEDFTWGINQLMDDDELLYDSLTKDLYYLGIVLHKKYKYLRFAFNFFMFGIISSAIFYAIMQIIS